jgi:hypothetical protein
MTATPAAAPKVIAGLALQFSGIWELLKIQG